MLRLLRLRRLLLPVAFTAVPVAAIAAMIVTSAGGASADYAGPAQPIGTVEHVTAPDPDTVELTGWVSDPDSPMSNVLVEGVVDGTVRTEARTSIARPDIARRYTVGATPGFVLDVHVSSGWHEVCLVARNIGAGLNRVVKCTFTPLGRTLSSSQEADHSPTGAITWANAGPGYFHITGNVTDHDYLARRLELTFYLDGRFAATATTDDVKGWTPPEGAGPNSRFDVTLRHIVSGAHLVCVKVTDVGPGSDISLGCRASDTRGKGIGQVTPPAVNAQIVTEAKKHIGQAYVWGAEGPKTFDCSGLVMYSYSKVGVTTPRVSQDQFHAARVISAARAVPGDLVFYHDSTGDVYHVGIYLSPGKTVAAIDTAEGVNYQTIWDPDTATYGSFTHS